MMNRRLGRSTFLKDIFLMFLVSLNIRSLLGREEDTQGNGGRLGIHIFYFIMQLQNPG
jgi:hypothetical protein